jgi:16S rRNA (guanine(966)-N(2))-methyltransferase RsmD
MRVIAGKVKGHHLKFERSTQLRPTSDMVKGAIFSTLNSLDTDLSRVLDLYAGTGALGIEALSRGASHADFVEKAPKFCAIIKNNLNHTKLSEQSHVYCCTVNTALSFLKEKYMLVLMDPPYADPKTPDMLQMLADSTIVGEGSTLVVEHAVRSPLAETYGCFCQVKKINHGDTSVSIYRFEVGGQS